MRSLVLLLALSACQVDPATTDDTDEVIAIDLLSHLDETQARAGVITDPAALIGGIGAEARPGDVMIKNDRARFIIQAADRDSGGLVPFGGGVIDADIARPDGSASQDVIMEWITALDVGWMPEPTRIEVVDDGLDSGTAVVRVEAVDQTFQYMEGVLENIGASPPRGIAIVTTYTLEAASPLMKVETTLTLDGDPVILQPGDIIQALPGITSSWVPGVGRVATPGSARDAVMLTHNELGLTMGVFADDRDDSSRPSSALDLLNFIVSFTSLYEPSGELMAGTPRSWTRWWGIGKDPAVLTDAWLQRTNTATDTVAVTVTDGTAPLAGVRVNVLLDDAPFTLAITDAQGVASAEVPAGSSVRFVADGSGSRIIDDLPAGAGDASPLAHSVQREASLASMRDGATPTPHARGYGRNEGAHGDTIVLTPPGFVSASSAMTDRFELRLKRTDAQPADDALGLPVPDGQAALAYPRNGSITVPVEPGSYNLLAWHGTRWEVHEESLEVVSGQTVEVSLTDLVPGPTSPGWWVADTHSHSAPSFDGKISPTERALVSAATGLDLWIASEHDVAIDHAPMVEALGLSDDLRVVGSIEVTPWVRGHVNLFPSLADPDARAGGAWTWWEHLRPTTTEQFDLMLEHHPDTLVQINHPFSPGMPSLAGWEPGVVAHGDKWWDGFDVLEVIVPGQTPKGLDLYLDLSARGILTAASGSSDGHDHTQNDPGLLTTWIYMPGIDKAGDLTDEDIIAAFEARHTIASSGAFLDLDPLPGSTVAPGTELTVQAISPSWIKLNRATLYMDGEVVETIPLDESGMGSFTLDADSDASFVVEARGDQSMQPLQGRTPWVVASAIQVDVGGDGWTPPLPPLTLE